MEYFFPYQKNKKCFIFIYICVCNCIVRGGEGARTCVDSLTVNLGFAVLVSWSASLQDPLVLVYQCLGSQMLSVMLGFCYLMWVLGIKQGLQTCALIT